MDCHFLEFRFQIASYLMNAKTGAFLFLPGFVAPERATPMFETIIRNAPSWEKAPLAQFNIGKIYEMTGSEEEAIAAFETLQNRYPSSPLVGQAAFRESSCLYLLSTHRKNDENALNAARAALVDFIKAFPSSPDVATAEAYLQTLNTRRATMAFERAQFYDTTKKRPEAALIAYQDFVRNFPSSELVEKANQHIEELRKTTK